MAMPLTQTQNFCITQTQTQGGSHKVRLSEICVQLIAHSKRIGSRTREEVEKSDPKFLQSVSKVFDKFRDNERAKKVLKFLLQNASSDNGNKFSSFVEAWFNITRTQLSAEWFREFMIVGVIDSADIILYSFHAFVSVHNEIITQSALVTPQALLKMCDHIGERIKVPKETNKRWKDCISVIVCRIAGLQMIDNLDGTSKPGRDTAESILSQWMRDSTNHVIFDHIVKLAADLGFLPLIERYLEEVVENLYDKDQRDICTWKSIVLTQCVTDAKRLIFCWSRIVRAWPGSDVLNDNLFPSIKIAFSTLLQYPVVARAVSTLLKNEKGSVLSSEFGFLTYICMCDIERHKTLCISELKRCLARVYRFSDEVNEVGWMADSGSEQIMDKVQSQMMHLIERLSKPEQWDLFGSPSISMAYALLEVPSPQQVTIADGRVADGPPLWILASRILSASMISRPENLSNHLLPLIRAISTASHGTNSAAALVLIDVLVDVVKKCTLEVLNNWKLLDGLFEWVCHMRRDIAISLIRCLLPVINQRPQLRIALFDSLKKDLLSESTVSSAVPLVLLLLRSVSVRKSSSISQGDLSQSFATFSTQSLSDMGASRGVDQKLSLEIIGILKRCLTQPAPTRASLYKGMTEVVARNPHIVAPCLDLLISHSKTVPLWTPENLVIASRTLTQCREALPQLIQAMEALTCEAISSVASGLTQSEGGDLLAKTSEDILDNWVDMAVQKDVHDLGVDKLSEWNPATTEGRSNLLFSYLMVSVYDILVEHVWRKLYAEVEGNHSDALIGLMKRRGELNEVLNDKMVKRKEAKVGTISSDTGVSIDLQQADTTTSARTIAHVLKRVLSKEAPNDDPISEVRLDLLGWAVDRAVALSEGLLTGQHPLHSTQSQTIYLTEIATLLYEFYVGADCAEWIQRIETVHTNKTKALQVYSNLLRYLCTKYRLQMLEKVVPIFEKSQKGGGAVGALVRHMHRLLSKQYANLLVIDRGSDEDEKKKKGVIEIENQAKIITKLVSSIIDICDDTKVPPAVLKFCVRLLQHNIFANIAVLRDLLRLTSDCMLKIAGNDHQTTRVANTISDEVLALLGDEGTDDGFQCVERHAVNALTDFLIGLVDKSLASIRSLVTFSNDFFQKNDEMDTVMTRIMEKCLSCSELVLKLAQLYTKFNMQKDKVTALLTNYFTSLEVPVKIILDLTKSINGIREWKSVTELATIINTKLNRLLVECDQNVGIYEPEENSKKGGKQSTKIAKSKKDETTYVRYVRARESVQSKILLLCGALKDNRLDLQVKKNSIGLRDFKLDLGAVTAKMRERQAEDPEASRDSTAGSTSADRTNAQSPEGEAEEPPKKKRKPRVKKEKQ